ncbi:MAG: YbjN domain-containing protein [Deltaproteobacteria bacterium]|nr:YbjN domain-containing protein [Deltaproteobacteria bacterium]
MTHLRVDSDTVESLLRSEDWPCERIGDSTWRSRAQGMGGSFPFLIHLDRGGFLNFAVVPFARSPESKQAGARLYRRLLELNHSLLMAKFSIDDDLDVVLSVEYPTAELDASEFRDAVDVLTYYADRYHDELTSLAGSTE